MIRSLLLLPLALLPAAAEPPSAPARKPNLVVILADDIGYGDLGCFGQQALQTPRLDRMVREGMRLTQFYAGGATGTPSRRVMLSGRHGGRPPRPDGPTVATMLKDAGYATACVGQWGLGPPGKLTSPADAGFGHFFGALNLPHANNPFPEFLVRDGAVVRLRNEAAAAWKPFQDPARPDGGKGVAATKADYAPALELDAVLAFIRDRQRDPFFLYLALTVPHANGAAGADGMDAPGAAAFAARDWPAAEKGFAAQVATMDAHVGRVLDLLTELKIDRHTLVLFASDNGPAGECGHRPDFFKSAGPLRGGKGDVLEGGIRVPAIAWWPGTVAPGGANDLQWYVGDVPATAAELAGVPAPAGLDSDSLLPTLRGAEENDRWKRRSPLYWDTRDGKTAQAVRFGKWKALRSPIGTGPVELYDMSNDAAERRDYSQRRPDLTRHATTLLDRHQSPAP